MTKHFIALIADMVGSREVAGGEQVVKDALTQLIAKLNKQFEPVLESRFAIVKGDEFQALINDPSVIPDVIWFIHTSFTVGKIRFGIGYGPVKTDISGPVGSLNGPAFYHAQSAIDRAHAAGTKHPPRKSEELGGVFEGFPGSYDEILTGWSTIMRQVFQKFTPKQQQIFSALYLKTYHPKGLKQKDLASRFGLSEQNISNQKRAAGWHAFEKGMNGWRLSLKEAAELVKMRGDASIGTSHHPVDYSIAS
jgi:hypothetical protein